MSFNGAGTFSLPAGNPVVTNTTVSSTVHNNTMTEIASGLSNAICKDGQTTITGNLPMAGYKFTGLGAGATTGDSLRYEQVFSAGTVALLGNLSIGTSNNGSAGLTLSQDDTLSWNESSTESLPGIFRIAASASLVLGYAVKYSSNADDMASSYGSAIGHSAITVGNSTIAFNVNASDTVTVGTDVTMLERMRLTDGHLLVGRANSTNFGSFSNTVAGVAYAYTGAMHLARDSAFSKLLVQDITNRAGTYISFGSGSTTTGSISTDGTATAYNTTSDGRLKENVKRLENVGDKLDAVRPVEFDWASDKSKGYGFIAQELHDIFPEAVTPGDDELGRPWMIDYSKVVPYLVAEIQDLRARVAVLEQR